MIYLMLAAIALFFGLLGFLLNAFYFSKAEMVENLTAEIDRLRRMLRESERKNRNLQEQFGQVQAQINLLESQLRQRNEEFGVLYFMALRRDEEMGRMQRNAAEKSSPVICEVNSPEDDKAKEPAFLADEIKARPAPPHLRLVPVSDSRAAESAVTSGVPDTPLWKRKLDNVLSILDAIEK
jgi:ribosome-binding ATPase YchF (GTP1/OBG family)